MASLFNSLIVSDFYHPDSQQPILGGPETIDGGSVYLPAVSAVDFPIAEGPDDVASFAVVDSSFLSSAGTSLSNILPTRDGLMIYKAQRGDNLSTIAANFGISLNTIFWSNPQLSKRGILKTGQEIVILPISGVLHRVKDGESIVSIAANYSVSPNMILKFNKKITVGSTIVVPGAKPIKNYSYYNKALKKLPQLPGYFAIPTTGWNWGRLHNNNAVDIANACGNPIYAAAEGLVVKANIGWNHGYGNYVMIEHPNGVSTRYAHTQKNLVEVGQYVLQGDLIAYMGNTGNTHGPTGCHLHFEVIGAQNPFAK